MGAFAASCNLRDMGTYLCALPTGEHCPKGLICLGCARAQPMKSAVPIFRRMLVSHERSLVSARDHPEPAGQIAAGGMEIVRIKGALQRAEELSDDVATAIERAFLSRITVDCERQRTTRLTNAAIVLAKLLNHARGRFPPGASHSRRRGPWSPCREFSFALDKIR